MKDHILYDSIDMKCPQQVNLWRQEVDCWLLRPEGPGGKWAVTADGYGVSFWGVENVLQLIVVMTVQLCEYAKHYCIVHFKLVNCIVAVHLNKALIKNNEAWSELHQQTYEVDGRQSMASKEWVCDSHVKLFTASSK